MSVTNTSLSPAKEASLIIFLAAIWGASFLFMRILVPIIPPIVMANLRILLAGIGVYLFYAYSKKINHDLGENWKKYLIAGIFNSAIPFTLYGFAAKYLPAGYSAILNAMTPLFTAILAGVYLDSKITKTKILGLILGFLGVYVLMQPKIAQSNIHGMMPILAMIACIGATICYAIGSTYTKKKLSHSSSENLACYTQLLAAFVMLPLWIFTPPIDGIIQIASTPKLLASLFALALICSGLAYVLFFYLLKNSGTIKATSTTFIIPLFGILWAYLFLGEELPHTAYISGLLIISSTILVLRNPKKSKSKI
jgi:drug/metabolite transporter (DMT)-like permease